MEPFYKIEFENFEYNKEYVELIEAFLPKNKNKGLNILFKKEDKKLILKACDYNDEIFLNEKIFESEKSTIKHHMYELLSKYTKKDLEWGMLVGVNPLKLFSKLISDFGEAEASNILRRKYFVSDKKIVLGKSVLKNQKVVRNKVDGNYSLYVDIPFCIGKCSYCSFPTYSVDEEIVNRYVETLIFEISKVGSVIKKSPDFLYLGGGTPSAIGPENLEKILTALRENFGKSKELTVEIGRPDTFSEELLAMLKKCDVDRISINPQSMKDETLTLIGRSHTKKDTLDAYYLARKLGFENINMDVIMGLPKETPEDFSETLKEVCKLDPESITIHALAIKKGSKLYDLNYFDKYLKIYERIRDEYMKMEDFLPYYIYRQKNMYLNSENIGYAKDGFQCGYNISMMEDLQNIVGLGLSSSSKFIKDEKIVRQMNYRNMKDYIENTDKNIAEKLSLLEDFYEN